ncbi:hypothetical protein BsWGS_12103 [Bradybaena similaris]
MSKGLRKAKDYDWKDSNLALFGSDTEKAVKKSSAESEPAWKGAGAAPGLCMWQIKNFKVESVPKEDHGKFYNGDSYIVLNTYKDKDGDKLLHDVHFWIGKNSSQDEYGTAAYKTVELDTYLDDVPVQHRECQGHESDLFKSYFPKGLTLLEGGSASGFRNVPAEEYEARLLHFCRDKTGHVVVKQIPRSSKQIKEDDVYILDNGCELFQYNGSNSSPMERSKAAQYVAGLKSDRGDVSTEVLDGEDTPKSHPFWKKLDEDDDDGLFDDDDGIPDKRLLRVDTEKNTFTVVKEGSYSLGDLKSEDVFILDSGEVVFVWIGGNASAAEKKNGLPYAHNYLRASGFPWRPVTVVKEGQKCQQFDTAHAA